MPSASILGRIGKAIGLAFGLLAIQRMLLITEFALLENQAWAYGIRLLAFLLIIYAIIMKNRKEPA
jgi:hypothetical protein